MPKPNEPEAPTVSATDPRTDLQATLDAQSVNLNARLRKLFATRKQIDLEIEATQAALNIADDGIAALSSSLSESRERALMEKADG